MARDWQDSAAAGKPPLSSLCHTQPERNENIYRIGPLNP